MIGASAFMSAGLMATASTAAVVVLVAADRTAPLAAPR